jgi:hypothetical protein
MNFIGPAQPTPLTEAARMKPSVTRGTMNTVMLCREWAEEHWEAVCVTTAILSSISVAAILAVGFNVMSTQLAGFR